MKLLNRAAVYTVDKLFVTTCFHFRCKTQQTWKQIFLLQFTFIFFCFFLAFFLFFFSPSVEDWLDDFAEAVEEAVDEVLELLDLRFFDFDFLLFLAEPVEDSFLSPRRAGEDEVLSFLFLAVS